MMKLYSLFHLNTSFSSIEKNDQQMLIKKCYWPLLEIIEKNDFKIAIELSGKTLLDIFKLDKIWIKKFKSLLDNKKCELIGSGFSQVIGPLVPEEITQKNIIFGNQIYKKILNKIPKIGLINEQAFSKSMIKIYNKFYDAIIIDWINAKANVNEQKIQDDAYPCFLKDDFNNKIKVIWSNSIAFQKFQRFIFDEISFKNFIKYVDGSKKNNFCCIYSNDAEVFNFRAKRFGAENKIALDEWKKILSVYEYFYYKRKKYKFVSFSSLLKVNIKKSYKVTNCKNPIIVKKQAKYNINRWAVCGKDNLLLNTYCWQIYKYLKNKKNEKLWKKLCELWGSDYRTHTTKKKWLHCKNQLEKIIKRYKINKKIRNTKYQEIKKIDYNNQILRNKNFITFKNKNFLVSFNVKKGLAIENLIDRQVSTQSLLGTIVQGDIKNYGSSSDFFSGNFSILKKRNLLRFSDLSQCNYKIFQKSKNLYLLNAIIKDKESKIIVKKNILIDMIKKIVKIKLDLNNVPDSIVRLFKMTINPNIFNEKQLAIKTHNGGKNFEHFNINEDLNHGTSIENVSNYTSSNSSFGITKEQIIFGDKQKSIIFEIDKSLSSLVAMLEYTKLKQKFFLRLFFSAYESDDTSFFLEKKNFSSSITIKTLKKSINLFK